MQKLQLTEIAAAAAAYRRAYRTGGTHDHAEAGCRLYRAFGAPLGQRGTTVWLEFCTWTTAN